MGRYHRIITLVLAVLIPAGFVGAGVSISYLESKTDFLARAGGIERRLETRIAGLADPAEQCSAFYQATTRLDADDFRLFSEWIMGRFPFVSGLIFAPLVPAAERHKFEESVRDEGLVTFRIHAPVEKSASQTDAVHFLPIFLLEPLLPESAFLLGLDLESRQEFTGILSRVVAKDTTLLVESPGLLEQTREFWLVRAVFRGRSGTVSPENAAGLILLRIDLVTVVERLLKGKERSELTLALTGDPEGPDQIFRTPASGGHAKGHLRFNHEERFRALGRTFLSRYWEEIPLAAVFFNRVVAMAFIAGITVFLALMCLSGEYRRRRNAYVELARINQELQESEEQLRRLNEVLEERVRERTLELVQSRDRLQDIIDSTSDWIWEVDAKGAYTFCSGRIQEVLGYEPEEVLGRTPFDLMSPEEVERIGEAFAGIAAQRAPIVNIENWNLAKDGRRVCLLTNGVPVLDDEGRFTGYRGADQDITERRLLDDRLRDKNEDLARSNAELDEFAYIVSHDLKEPLRSIRSFSAFILEDYRERLEDEGKSHLDIVIQSAERMEALLDGLLIYSRAGRAQLAVKPTDLGGIVSDVLKDMRTLLDEQNAASPWPGICRLRFATMCASARYSGTSSRTP